MAPTKKTIEEQYRKMDQRTHVYERPTMYMGSICSDERTMEIFDDEKEKIVRQKILFVPALFKLFDEVITNASDHTTRADKNCKNIKIYINKKEGYLKVWNDGEGIPVEIHKEHKIYIPEMIFGHLLTSSNYDDNDERTGAGTNGLGVKLCNVMSKKFIIETVENGKKYYQEFKNNMLEKNEPVITKTKDSSYTCVTYYPDFDKFGLKGLIDSDVQWVKKRSYDISTTTNKLVSVYFNDDLINIKKFDEYINLYYENPVDVAYDYDKRWKIGCVFNATTEKSKSISFVNGNSTYEGGSHVDYIYKQIIEKIMEELRNKRDTKKIADKVKPAFIKEFLDIFVDATIVNPAFSSQTKSKLTTKPSDFGSEFPVDDGFIKKILKSNILDALKRQAEFKEELALNKTDGKKNSRINLPNLVEATYAGQTKHVEKCRLVLTEGNSAFSYFLHGREIIGSEYYGGFPLRGKIINVRGAPISQISKSAVVTNLKQILGLQNGKKYNSVKDLRYGGIIILTDADVDGSHIKGLLINFFHHFWPELLENNLNFIQTMKTPLIGLFKTGKKTPEHLFYSDNHYNAWLGKNTIGNLNVKYFKGLGSSDERLTKMAFEDFDDKIVSYMWEEEKHNKIAKVLPKNKKVVKNNGNTESVSFDNITLAFDKDRADDRKIWLKDYDDKNIIDYDKTKITYSEFIHKDLKHFSNDDNLRSIPKIMDGLKPSQRKILFTCFKIQKYQTKNGYVKVCDCAGDVSSSTAYKHGNVSLEEAIFGMGQNYAGSNNINLLYPDGHFGGRRSNGEDHASSRYAHTRLESITRYLFRKEDDIILDYIVDEGDSIEPQTYYPIIPTILINGTLGMGTGFSTNISLYNPKDVIANIKNIACGKDIKPMVPYFQGFNGIIDDATKERPFHHDVYGKYEQSGPNTIIISELPLGSTTCLCPKNYEEKVLKPLMGLAKKGSKEQVEIIDSYVNNCGVNKVSFEVKFKPNEFANLVKHDEFESKMKLKSAITTSNMILYNTKNDITKYKSVNDIMKEYFNERLRIYEIRKKEYLKKLENDLNIIKYKVKYIKDIINKDINVNGVKEQKLIEQLEKKKYAKLHTDYRAKEEQRNFGYLLCMHIISLTEEKIAELEKELEKTQKNYDLYLQKSEIELWLDEIEEFEREYNKWLDEKDKERMEIENTSTNKKKKGKK